MGLYLGTAPIAEYESGQKFNTEENEGGEVIPSTENIVLPAKSYFKNDLIIKGDPNLVESNIKKDTSLFGKTGIAENPCSNGTKWIQSMSDSSLYALCYGNGIWTYGKEYYSTDGKNWIKSENGNNSVTPSSYYANGIRVASDGTNGLYYSTDGKTWTQSNITSGMSFSVYYGNGIWEAAGLRGFSLCYSTDGKTWTQNDSISGEISLIRYGDGIWVACTNSGLWYSKNGVEWILSNITDYFGIMNNVIYYANGIWIVSDNFTIYYSANGQTWETFTIEVEKEGDIYNYGLYSAYNANNVWVGGCNESGLYYSADGKNWNQSNITTGNFYIVYNANGLWIAGGDIGLYYSVDGKNWTQSNTMTFNSLNSILYANGIWIASDLNGLHYSIAWEPET